MKYYTRLLFGLVLLGFFLFHSGVVNVRGQAEGKGIDFFQGTWKEAVTRAKEEKKCLFLDAYASWCGPCRAMENEVFTKSEVGDYFNQKFVAIRVDMEKGEGPELAKKFSSIDGYPSLLFFTDGHLAKTILGSRTAEEFLQEAKLVAK